MKLTSKYDEGKVVWFLHNVGGDQPTKFYEGTVTSVQSWDKWSGFRYDITHIGPDGIAQSFNVEERNVYASKNEVLSTAFEENGVELVPDAKPEA